MTTNHLKRVQTWAETTLILNVPQTMNVQETSLCHDMRLLPQDFRNNLSALV